MYTIVQTPLKVPFARHYFSSGSDDHDPGESSRRPSPLPPRGEELPYRVEVWNADFKSVELTLAMTANGSIGYAAYYEATREYPERYVVLRHKNRIVARWNPLDA